VNLSPDAVRRLIAFKSSNDRNPTPERSRTVNHQPHLHLSPDAIYAFDARGIARQAGGLTAARRTGTYL
jgi:hypothetical protein